MNKITGTFINNAGKSNQKPVIEYSAHTGKRVRVGDELNITLRDITKGVQAVLIIIGVIGFCYMVRL